MDVTADYLDRWGRTGEAVSLVTPYAAAGHQLAARRMAGLLVHQGRVDDAIALLGPRVDDWYLARRCLGPVGWNSGSIASCPKGSCPRGA